MADETSRDQSPDSDDSATPNRDRRQEPPIVIEGEIVQPEQRASAPPASEPPIRESEAVDEARVETPPPEGRPILSAAVGAIVGAVVAGGGLWYLGQRPPADPDLAARLENLERNPPASASPAAITALDKRITQLEAAVSGPSDKSPASAYGQRIEALESAALSAKAAADANKDALAQAQAARDDATKALTLATSMAKNPSGAAAPADQAVGAAGAETGAFETRIGKLETELAALNRPAADLSSVNQRLDKLEGALAAPKSENRVAAEPAGADRDTGAALAVVAQALSDRLRVGAAFPLEQAALAHLGADPAKLAKLKPFVEKGGPTAGALAADFVKISPAILAAATPQSSGGALDRLMANMKKAVRVTRVGEVAGDDPAALVSQIGAALGRGQIASAIAIWERLPEPARQASQDWANQAQSRIAADKAAQDIVDEAMTQLAATKN
jgi:hypothetical protein